MSDFKSIRKDIVLKTIEYYKARFIKADFVPGKSRINYAGRVFDQDELINAVEASLDFWLTEGRFSESFAEKIAEFLGINFRETWRKKIETGRRSNFCCGWLPGNSNTNYSAGLGPCFR